MCAIGRTEPKQPRRTDAAIECRQAGGAQAGGAAITQGPQLTARVMQHDRLWIDKSYYLTKVR